MVFTIIIVVILIASLILALVVLVQNPKGGGISGTFGGAANQIFGYKRSTDDIERITWILVIAIFVLSLGSAAFTGGDANVTPVNTLDSGVKQPPAQMPVQQDPNALPVDNGSQVTIPTDTNP